MPKTVKEFLCDAFEDMAESAKAQHAVDKANFGAAKAEGAAGIAKARANANPKVLQAAMQARRDEQLAQAQKRILAAKQHSRPAQ